MPAPIVSDSPLSLSPARPPGRGRWFASWYRAWFGHAILYLLAALPVLFVLARAADATRNIAYWDEFDTDLRLVLRLDAGVTPSEFLGQLFAIANEHRILTRRLLVSTAFGIMGTIDFEALAVLGNASILVLCGLLLREAGTSPRRVRLALVLGFVLFHLAHYENMFWPGSSLDHFMIVLIASAALIGIARGTAAGLVGGMALGALATFTLAQGLMTWPIGAAMLWRAKRRRDLLIWCGAAVLVAAAFLVGFKFNAAHSFSDMSLLGFAAVITYWLTLLGSVPALDNQTIAPLAGIALLAVVGWLARQGAVRREPVMFPVTCFALAAAALIAVGRSENAGGMIHSRYLILSALAWALTVFMLLERYSHPRRPFAILLFALPGLAGFNVAANVAFAQEADSWMECRDRAALGFIEHGQDGKVIFKLHPDPATATELLRQAERRGVYRMPELCEPRTFVKPRESARIAYYVEDMSVDRQRLAISGWAAIRGRVAQRGTLHLVLRSEHSFHVFTTVAVSRPDVVDAMHEPDWLLCGFRFARTRERLPVGEYQVGFLINARRGPEYIMTSHRVNLDGAGQVHLAK